MPNFLLKRWHKLHNVFSLLIMFFLSVGLSIYHWIPGLIGLLLTIASTIYLYIAERAYRREFKQYVQTLSYRLKTSGTDIFQHLPFGVILFNEDYMVEWHNPYITSVFKQENLVGEQLGKLFPSLSPAKDVQAPIELMINQKMYSLTVRDKARVVYVNDITESWAVHKKYDEERLSLGIVMIDNLEEVAQGIDDNQRSALLSKV
jgi:c-di-AMP phosphodiesterase-like protein